MKFNLEFKLKQRTYKFDLDAGVVVVFTKGSKQAAVIDAGGIFELAQTMREEQLESVWLCDHEIHISMKEVNFIEKLFADSISLINTVLDVKGA